jgi:hypothetical protein
MEESTTYQAILARGQLREARRFLIRQGRIKLGEPDAATLAALEGVNSLERLEELGERRLGVDTWPALLAAN